MDNAGNNSANISSSKELLLLYSPSRRQQTAAAAFLLIILLIFRVQILVRYNTHFLGGYEADAGLYLWLVKSNLHHLFSEPWFNTKAFYPFTRTLAWSDNYILPSLAMWPLLKLGLSFESSYNSILMLANLLNGFVTFRLAFGLTGAWLPAIFAGSLFMCFSYLGLQLGHPQLQFAFWIPAGVCLLFKFLQTRSWRIAALLGFTVFLCFLCCVYYAVFITIAVPALVLALLLVKPAFFPARVWPALIFGGLLGLAPILFFILPYLDVRGALGARQLIEARAFAASALSYLSAPAYNLLYNRTAAWSHAEANLFPGAALLILIGVAWRHLANTKRLRVWSWGFCLFLGAGAVLTLPVLSGPYWHYAAALCLWCAIGFFVCFLIKLGRLEIKLGFSIITNRNLVAAFFFLALIAFCISLGPLGGSKPGRLAPGVFTAFYYSVPGLNSIRAISRIGVVTVFSLIMAGTFALHILIQSKGLKPWFPLLCLLVGLLENFNCIYPVQPASVPSGAFNTLASSGFKNSFAVEPNDVLIVLPLASELTPDRSVKSWSRFAVLNVNYMNWSAPSDVPLVNGYSGQRTRFMDKLPGRLADFPDSLSLKALAGIAGLRYILYVPRYAPEGSAGRLLGKAQTFSSELNHLLTDDQGNLLFEYTPTTKIAKDFVLRAPSFPQGFLHLELMALYQENSPVVNVPIRIMHDSGRENVSTIQITANGEWKVYSVRTPSDTNRCLPISVSFEVPEQTTLYLRKRRFEGIR